MDTQLVKENPLDRLRAICFEERPSMWCKAPPGAQDVLVNSKPEQFFVPPYVGHRGWLGVRTDGDVDWTEIAELCEDAYRVTAPTRLIRILDSRAP